MVYVVINFGLSQLASALERRLRRGRKAVTGDGDEPADQIAAAEETPSATLMH